MPIVIRPKDLANFGAGNYDNDVRKFGRVVNAGAVPTVVWDGSTPYEGWLPSEETLVIVSTSDEDKPGGAGIQYLEWTGQGEDGIEKVYSIILDGTTPVESITSDPNIKWDIIYTSQGLNTEGSNLSPTPTPTPADLPANRGTITIKSKTTDKIMAQINPGNGRTQMMIYRVPKDNYGEITKIDAYPTSGSTKPIVAELWGRNNKTLSWINFGLVDMLNDIASIDFPTPSYLSPGFDICIVIKPEQTATDCSAQMWIKKKPIMNYEKLLLEESL